MRPRRRAAARVTNRSEDGADRVVQAQRLKMSGQALGVLLQCRFAIASLGIHLQPADEERQDDHAGREQSQELHAESHSVCLGGNAC